jgi:hypothetical protein
MAHHLYHQQERGAGAPSLHVEVLQHSCSSLSASVVREYAVAQLKMQPTAFGEFTLSEFDDPVLKEHVVSIAVCDIPTSIQVRNSEKNYHYFTLGYLRLQSLARIANINNFNTCKQLNNFFAFLIILRVIVSSVCSFWT